MDKSRCVLGVLRLFECYKRAGHNMESILKE